MMDFDRVVTLDDLVESVPEALVREAEQKRLASEEIIDDSHHQHAKETRTVARDQSKAQRIREYLETNPEARNKDVVEALKQFKVTAADVANVKSLTKRTAGKRTSGTVRETKRTVERSESTGLAPVGASVSLPELEAGVAFIKASGSITRAKHVLIIIEQIRDNVK
jgi:hypothetical protein